MKYTLRLVWYVTKITAIAAAVFAVLAVIFFVAMDSANVYVIVTDGMKARAASILTPDVSTDLTKYFTSSYLRQHTGEEYDFSSYRINDFNYKLTVDSIWCKPWQNVATVKVVESIPEMSYEINADQEPDKTKEEVSAPRWQKAKYQITCRRTDGVWRIYEVLMLEAMMPDPTRTPEPTLFITATPVPTPSPTKAPLGAGTPTPSPTDTGEGQ